MNPPDGAQTGGPHHKNAQPGSPIAVLLSGGADSAVVAALAVARGEAIWPLYVCQGFVWETEELAAVERFLTDLTAAFPGMVHPLSVSACVAPRRAMIAWAQEQTYDPPDQYSLDEAVYIPGRNLALLTQAALLADAEGLERVALGILRSNPFPDASDQFFRAFERASSLAFAPDGAGRALRVETPLAGMSKEEVLRLGAAVRPAAEIPAAGPEPAPGPSWLFRHTISCLRPSDGVHCGRCNKCAERRAAFARAGVEDPSRYAA